MYNFEKLTAWNKAMEFCEVIYNETKHFPKEEIFGLTSQLRRAATSIPLNIAEGSACSSKREFRHFLTIALGSQYEVVTIVRLSKRLEYIKNEAYCKIAELLDEIGKLLHGLINSLSNN